MNEVGVLVEELRHAFEGSPWHGPSLFGVLGRLTAETADQRGAAPHSPWQLALHIQAWVPAVHRRLDGKRADLGPDEDWPAVVEASPQAWMALRAAIEADEGALLRRVAAMSVDALHAPIVGKHYDAAFMLHGLAQHIAYHSGQIAILERSGPDQARGLLRHALATLAYRGSKAIRGVPAGFGDFEGGSSLRTPLQILAHIGDLCDWSLALLAGEHKWSEATASDWTTQSARFHAGLAAIDVRLNDPRPLGCSCERIFQGPIADALTHVGQIALLRRMAGSPVRGENYFKADIQAGVLGAQQPPPRREFD